MRFLRFLLRHIRWIALLLLAASIPVAATALRAVQLIKAFEAEPTPTPSTLYDAAGEVLTSLGQGGRFVPFGEIPKVVRDAVVAIEDARFWSHPGVDAVGIARAVVVNLRRGTRAQGGSTITQQLARNLFLSPEKSYVRKFQEAIIALLLEARFSKSEILALYLNRVYFGDGAYGIDEAARTYFGKAAQELTLPEGALLAGLLRAPSRYSPYANPELALERRSIVLSRMEELGLVTAEEAQAAKDAPLELAGRRGGEAPYFVDYVENWLVERFGADRVFHDGLHVVTTLDRKVQEAAEAALGGHQGAVVALDPQTGHVVAMVGGRDYVESQFNRATQSRRQPGSAFKPFVYAAALEQGWQMNDLVEDVPRTWGDYSPQNFRGEYWGRVTMKHALVESLNNGSVWLLERVGVDRAIALARRLGITTLTPDDRHLALALGGLTQGVIPLEMAAAYVPFANGGLWHEPVPVKEVRDRHGALLYQHRPAPRRVLSEEVAFFITDMLRDAVERGTGTAAAIGRPQAGKTGTTDDQRSAWFVGYTPDLVAAVYIGNDDGTPLQGGGGTLAAPVWSRMMSAALAGRPAVDFPVPPWVVTGVPVDIFTGLLAGEGCPYRESDSFVAWRAPRRYAPCAWDTARGGEHSGEEIFPGNPALPQSLPGPTPPDPGSGQPQLPRPPGPEPVGLGPAFDLPDAG